MDKVIDKYLNDLEKEEFLNIISLIYNHKEFKRRNTNEFLHHSDITLSNHIIEVACLSYLKGKKLQKKDKTFNLKACVLIAMMHDLYCIPWQNNDEARVKHFSNKHGFRHPLEAVINAITWFPELFDDDKQSTIIIDGIIHHMYPLGVRVLSNHMELKNENDLKNIDKKYIEIIKKSTNRFKLFHLSFAHSKFKEGRVVSICDKKVSIRQIKNIYSLTSLITGNNKSIK